MYRNLPSQGWAPNTVPVVDTHTLHPYYAAPVTAYPPPSFGYASTIPIHSSPLISLTRPPPPPPPIDVSPLYSSRGTRIASNHSDPLRKSLGQRCVNIDVPFSDNSSGDSGSPRKSVLASPIFPRSTESARTGEDFAEMCATVRPHIVVDQLNTALDMNGCHTQHAVPVVSPDKFDPYKFSRRPNIERDINSRRLFPVKPKPSEGDGWTTDAVIPNFPSKVIDSNTRGVIGTSVQSSNKFRLVRNHNVPKGVSDVPHVSGNSSETTATEVRNAMPLPLRRSFRGNNVNLNSLKRYRADAARLPNHSSLTSNGENTCSSEAGSKEINKRALAMLRDTDIVWDGEPVRPACVYVKDESATGGEENPGPLVNDEAVAAGMNTLSVTEPNIRHVIADSSDDDERSGSQESVTVESPKRRRVVITSSDGNMDEDSTHQASEGSSQNSNQSLIGFGDLTTAICIQSGTLHDSEMLISNSVPKHPSSSLTTPTGAAKQYSESANANSPSSPCTRVTAGIVKRYSINRKVGSTSAPSSAPRSPSSNFTRRGRGSMSLRIIQGHRIGGDSRECFANLDGKCMSGIFCRFEHAGNRSHYDVKVCSRLLRGMCKPECDCGVSHERLLPHQYPICAFFLRADCSSGTACTLLHVRHTPNIPPCEDFNKGTCHRGADCEFPHRYVYHVVKEKGTTMDDVNPATNTERKWYGIPLGVCIHSITVVFLWFVHSRCFRTVFTTDTTYYSRFVSLNDGHDGDMIRVPRTASINNRAWQTLMPNKRGYQEMQGDHEDDIEEEMDQQQYIQQQQFRRAPEGPRKRGRPRKFPAGVPPPDYLARIQAKAMDSQIHDLDYEDDSHQVQPVPQPSGARVVAMGSRAHMMGRGGSTLSGPPPRLSQPGLIRLPAPVGQAAQIASQRLPSIGGAPPKENKPLKVVTLLPNSRRVGGGGPRPVVSGIRTLGQPPANRGRLPQVPIEKQAEQIINQSVKMADRIISGQTIGDFNRIIDNQNTQIASLQDDMRKLNTMYTGLLEFKDNRIRQLENQVDRLQNEIGNAMKTWHSQLITQETALEEREQEQENDVDEHDNLENQHHQVDNIQHQQQVQQLRSRQPMQHQAPQNTRGGFIIEERIMRQNADGEMTEEIIESEVDEETFLRMQQEMDGNEMQAGGDDMIVHHQDVDHDHHEEVVDDTRMDAALD